MTKVMRAPLLLRLHFCLLLIGIYGNQFAKASINFSLAAEPTKNLVTLSHPAGHRNLYDLLHTKLEINFDWDKKYLCGIATLQLQVHYYPQKQLILDAHNLVIHEIYCVEANNKEPLAYQYVEQKLIIDLGKLYTKEELFFIEIHYTVQADPKVDWFSPKKQGIYFQEENLNIGRQIWTKGGPNTAASWFPTLDTPDQRCTQEMYITVDDQYITLSNGTLVYSTFHGNQTRTDYWRMDLPHAPYLFMLAVGNFSVMQDEWEDIPVNYYVDPAYISQAKSIFGRTPDMLELFSEKLDYPYPWPSYNQIVVQAYPSVGMEHTTAVVLSDRFHMCERELLNSCHEYILAHAMFYHWFGSLVTCQSWSQAVLNESLASLGPLLWQSVQYGAYEAQLHIWYMLHGYLKTTDHNQASLINLCYDRPIKVLDENTYYKGALVMQMLKYYIGEEAFWQSLSCFLKKYAFKSVEIHQLRKVFEEVTGEDLNWFFDQWFFSAGHPVVKIEHQYTDGMLTLKIWQKKDATHPIYRIPLNIDIWMQGMQQQKQICLDQVYQEYKWELDKQPELVALDHQSFLVGELEHPKSISEYAYLYKYGNTFFAKYESLSQLGRLARHSEDARVVYKKLLYEALEDSFWYLRMMAIEALAAYQEQDADKIVDVLINCIHQDPHSAVRTAAVNALNSFQQSSQYISTYQASMQDNSYEVANAALKAYMVHSTAIEKYSIIAAWEQYDYLAIVMTLANYYLAHQEPNKHYWFKDKVTRLYHKKGFEQIIPLWGRYIILVGTDQERIEYIHALKMIAKYAYIPDLKIAVQNALEQFPKKVTKPIIQAMEGVGE